MAHEPNYSYGEYYQLRRREPVAYNGTVLHELYFENLGPGGGEAPAAFKNWSPIAARLRQTPAGAERR